ncbi:MAG: RES family NAD+ phosphorylase [Chlorobi bacterium]|nr:RES family NAD+ phosphorylase [Chlorobiota bacterium]MCI0716315.1 RES family NAD+ phosphorylase [Chlorobiota bacterium]
MDVYKITLAKWSKSLKTSGNPARWNSKKKYMIYTSGSRALACLENIVHRTGEGLNDAFKIMTIRIPGGILIEEIKSSKLPPNWTNYKNYIHCQSIGDSWLDKVSSAVLKVPSAIIMNEYNYLINPAHADFKKIKLSKVEDFKFDTRLKS